MAISTTARTSLRLGMTFLIKIRTENTTRMKYSTSTPTCLILRKNRELRRECLWVCRFITNWFTSSKMNLDLVKKRPRFWSYHIFMSVRSYWVETERKAPNISILLFRITAENPCAFLIFAHLVKMFKLAKLCSSLWILLTIKYLFTTKKESLRAKMILDQ